MKYYFLFMILVFGCGSLKAQNITGKIINTEKQPIEGAYVFNKQSKKHAHTLENGKFLLENNQVGDSLQVGILGYKTATYVLIPSDFKDEVNIVLSAAIFELQEIVVSEQLNPLKTIAQMDLKVNPVNSSQEILRKVPGLFIGQHAGGGKAEQLFLRGFDIDHGTDINLSVDGMAVNMVSHAHGQGYSDLHFLIPETIEKIDFGKGPYYAESGDFNTAAYVKFKTKNQIQNSSLNFSYGQFNSLRTLGLFNLIDQNNTQNAYAAVEYTATDGPFVSPQNFNRLNIFSKYSTLIKENSQISLTFSHFTSRWDASGQIPERSVNNGSISRFGSIDDTEGGHTSRTNLNIENTLFINDQTSLKSNVFYSKYDFKLFSNFTFFLNDPIHGDQIKQQENRSIFGFNTQLQNHKTWGNVKVLITSGTGLRHDIINDIELSNTLNRKMVLQNIQLGNINQTNMYGFFNSEFKIHKFTIAPAVRIDHFQFLYNDALSMNYKTQAQSKSRVSPKLSFSYNQNQNIQWFLKTGIGFHSNDTRVILNRETKNSLPQAFGSDLGIIWKPFSKLIINTAAWWLFLDQEFVYVGDAGVVEPSGSTRRYGLDVGLRYQLNQWFYFNSDATYAYARSVTESEGNNYIPLAPILTVTGGISVSNYKGFSGGIRTRYLGDRPANEDYSITAKGYIVTDLNLSYTLKKTTLGISAENLFNVAWNETQFATESRLKNEINAVEEIHFTPGTPLFIKTSITYTF